MVEQQQTFLRDIWYYALPGERLKTGQMFAKQLLGEPVVFGRTRDGEAFALRDICPHRAVPLSCGRFDGAQIECAYHGWKFDRHGACTLIPALAAGQELDLSKFGVRRYPVREIQGNIWIYMADGERATTEPTHPVPIVEGFEGEEYQFTLSMVFPCFIDHAIVGLMDPCHVPFVHRSWWWRKDAILTEKSKPFDPSPFGFTMRRHQLHRKTFFYQMLGDRKEIEISFQLPGVRMERLVSDKHRVTNLTVITPISATETEVTTQFYTTLPWFRLFTPLLSPFVRTFLNQDRGMVVKQQIGLQYDPPLMLIKDGDAQAKWYYQIKAEFAKASAQGREFINPIKSQILTWRS